MIYEVDRKVTIDQIRNGEAASIARRLGIILAPNKNGLACQCDPRGDCTCRLAKPAITRDAKRPGIGHPHLIAAVIALRNIDDRLTRIEQHVANRQSQGMAQGPQQIVAAAKAKADDFLAARYAERIDNTILEHHQKRADQAYRMAHGDPSEPGHAHPQQRPDIDNEAHKHGAPLDPSSGDGRQKTTQTPMEKSRISNDGDFITPEQARQLFKQRDAEQAARHAAFMREANANRDFNARQHAMIKEIQAINDKAVAERWK